MLHLEIQFGINKVARNMEPLCDVLAPFVKKVRVVGGARHPQHGVTLIEAIDGLVHSHPASYSARE